MNPKDCKIKFENVSLTYDLYYDKTTSLKEFLINLVVRRKYVEKKLGKLNALNKINLEIEHGQRLGVIGLNGAGKSTLLKVIAGLLKPTEGNIEIFGNVQPLIEVGAGFNMEFSGRENIYFNGAMLGFSKKEIKEKEEEIIKFSELDRFIDVPVKYYSSGMILRLAFTIATIIHPEILVLDEIISAGDIEFIQKAKERINKLLSSAKILVIVSHDLGLIKSLALRTIVLEHGEIIFNGETKEAIEFYHDKALRDMESRKIKESQNAGK